MSPWSPLRISLPAPAVLGAVCLLAAAVPAQAQSDSLRAVLDTLPDDSRVRLNLRSDGEPVVGRLRPTSPGRLVLSSEAGDRRSVALEEVTRLWSDEGTHADRGALVGAAIGGATALVAGVALASDPSNETGIPPVTGGIVVGGLVGVPGVLGGALIGYQSTDWRLRFSADSGPGVAVQVSLP